MDGNIMYAIHFGLYRSEYKELKPNKGVILKQYHSGKDVLFCTP